MASGVLSVLLLVSCVSVRAEDCASYRDDSGVHHDGVACGGMHCCGSCYSKYCCGDNTRRLTGEQQERCDGRHGSLGPLSETRPGDGARWRTRLGPAKRSPKSRPQLENSTKTGVLLGSILGSVIPLIFCLGLVVCFVAPCCFLYKKCRKRRNLQHQNVPASPFIAVPQQPAPPAQHPSPHPSYQPVPVQPGYGDPAMPTAPPPPPYIEAAPPAYPQPHPGQHPQPPYNPSYGFVHT